ncbi:hypothetical protein PIB30_023384 [Stylosanthes scabra]|uniref:AP2/ERF domain-containing protein n=1 Tax=Stylosanthes scabra TaxID=79078 RepID=A0ABU6VCI1_9FABA|nr:hypothetical protein [Stylosanthes scabra]
MVKQNNNNVEKLASMEKSDMKYKGVRKRKWGKYVSEIRLPNSRERIWLGSYDTAEKAARAFDAAMFCLRGAAAKFNFPGAPPQIAGGRSMTPTQIQVAASKYANSDPDPVQPGSTSIESSTVLSEETKRVMPSASSSPSPSPSEVTLQTESDITAMNGSGSNLFATIGSVNDDSIFAGFDNFGGDFYLPEMPSYDYEEENLDGLIIDDTFLFFRVGGGAALSSSSTFAVLSFWPRELSGFPLQYTFELVAVYLTQGFCSWFGEIKHLEKKNGGESNDGDEAANLGDDGVCDPLMVRTKGTSRGNEPIDSRDVKRRKCSTCGELGHRKTRCPNPTKNKDKCSQDKILMENQCLRGSEVLDSQADLDFVELLAFLPHDLRHLTALKRLSIEAFLEVTRFGDEGEQEIEEDYSLKLNQFSINQLPELLEDSVHNLQKKKIFGCPQLVEKCKKRYRT